MSLLNALKEMEEMEEPKDNALVASGSVVQKDNALVASGSPVVQKDEFGLDVYSRPQSKFQQDLDRIGMVLEGADRKHRLVKQFEKERDETGSLFDSNDPFGGLA